MMTETAFIFHTPPHGSASGREGLDAVLACSALTDEIAVFFIGDGVYQLLAGQQPAAILARDHASTFKMLELYDIEAVYVCADSLAERGLTEADLLIPVRVLPRAELRAQLAQARVRLLF